MKFTDEEKREILGNLPQRLVVIIVFIVFGALYGNLQMDSLGEWVAGLVVCGGIICGDVVIKKLRKE